MTQPLAKNEPEREVIARVNRPIAPLLGQLMVRPEEFAARIRDNIGRGRSPRRLLRCIDDLELALKHRGIEMRAYFAALRRELFRAGYGGSGGGNGGVTRLRSR